MVEQTLVHLTDLFDGERPVGETLAVEPLQQVEDVAGARIIDYADVEEFAIHADALEEGIANGVKQVAAVDRDVHLAVVDAAVYGAGGSEEPEPGPVAATHDALVAVVVVVELVEQSGNRVGVVP